MLLGQSDDGGEEDQTDEEQAERVVVPERETLGGGRLKWKR
jgi:hypothetical protein